jgi:5-methylthioadenosine/S-adenosylhomocysteine deaminase
MRILIENAKIIPMSGPDDLIEQGYLLIEDHKITAIGPGRPVSHEAEKIIDGTGKVVLPGFINTHTHAAMTLLRGYADDLPLMEWLETKIWPLEAKLTAEYVYGGNMLACAEMIRSGTTTFADMYFFMEEAARAVEKSGLRGALARGLIGNNPEVVKSLEENLELKSMWHGKCNDRIRIYLGPHAPYTCSPDFLRQVGDLARKENLGVHIHVAETIDEINIINSQYHMTPVAILEETGLLENQVLAAHCVHVTAADMDILKKYRVGVAHNPESNMKLSSGIAPVPDMLAKGINVGLGTDGASSNNNLDLLQEMRSAAMLHKVANLPTTLPAYQALEMATVYGAAVLNQENEIGRLLPGFKADMIILNTKAPHMVPCYDIYANIVYAAQAADVETVIVDGAIVMENRKIKTFDEEAILASAQDIAFRLTKGDC